MNSIHDDDSGLTTSEAEVATVFVYRLRRSHLLNWILGMALVLFTVMRLMESCATTVRYETDDGLVEASVSADKESARFDVRLARSSVAPGESDAEVRLAATAEGARVEVSSFKWSSWEPGSGSDVARAILAVAPTEARLDLTFGDKLDASPESSAGSVVVNQVGSGVTLCRSPENCVRVGVDETSSFIRMTRRDAREELSLVQAPDTSTVTLSNELGEIVLRVGPDDTGGTHISLSGSYGHRIEIRPDAIVFRNAQGAETGRVDVASCPAFEVPNPIGTSGPKPEARDAQNEQD